MALENGSLQFLKGKGIINSSVQHVVAEYLDCRETLDHHPLHILRSKRSCS